MEFDAQQAKLLEAQKQSETAPIEPVTTDSGATTISTGGTESANTTVDSGKVETVAN